MGFTEFVIEWYRENGRDFPWRETENVFHILLAEIFLKKTTSTHVDGMFSEFVESFPTPKSIIEADKQTVISYLEPLGLQNKRYDQIVGVCKEIAEKHDGEVPKDREALLAMKGVGSYVANATLCFGYNQRYPIMDANVKRVIGRAFELESEEDIERKVGELLPEEMFEKFNYGLLDLGAVLYTPTHTGEGKCPVCQEKVWK